MKDMVFRRALAKFEKAVRAHEFKGASPPADWPIIQRDYEKSKADLIR
jgi:hypothetical protein